MVHDRRSRGAWPPLAMMGALVLALSWPHEGHGQAPEPGGAGQDARPVQAAPPPPAPPPQPAPTAAGESRDRAHEEQTLEQQRQATRAAWWQVWVNVGGALLIFLTLIANAVMAKTATDATRIAREAEKGAEENLRIAQEMMTASVKSAQALEYGVDAFRGMAVAMQETAATARLSAGIMQDTAERELRAYVLVKAADFTTDADGRPVVTLVLHNFGRTPALDVRSWIHTWAEAFPLTQDLPRAPDDLPMSRGVIGPGNNEIFVQPHGVVLNEWTRRQIEAGGAALYVYGEVAYTDIHGIARHTAYRLFARGGQNLSAGRLSPYTDGNTAT